MSDAVSETGFNLDDVRHLADAIRGEVAKAVVGQAEIVDHLLIATSFGMVEVSVQSPPPTPKSRRLTVALPLNTGLAPGAQVKSSVTGLLTPRSDSVPSAA